MTIDTLSKLTLKNKIPKTFDLAKFALENQVPYLFPEGYLNAFNDSANGFDLDWIEMEILSHAIVEVSVTDLRESINELYSTVKEIPLSTFYRDIRKLDQIGLISSRKSGRFTMVQTTAKGGYELGRANRYFFDRTRIYLKTTTLFLITLLLRDLGHDFKKDKIVGVLPELSDLKLVIDAANYYEEIGKQFVVERENHIQSYYLAFNGNIPKQHGVLNITYLQASPESLPVKSQFANVFISMSATQKIGSEHLHDYFKEIKRVLDSNGYVIFIELTTDMQTPSQHFLKKLSLIEATSDQSKSPFNPHFALPELNNQSIEDLLNQYFDDVVLAFSDYFSIFVCK